MGVFESDLNWITARQQAAHQSRLNALTLPRKIHYHGNQSPLASGITNGVISFLTVRASGTRKIYITGGNIACYSLGNFTVANSSVITIPDSVASTKVWVSFTGTWAFNTGTAWPTAVLFRKLADIDTTVAPFALVLLWYGGDLEPQECFPVTVADDGGAADPPTYIVTTLEGIAVVPTGGVPTNYRDAVLSYKPGSKGFGFFKSDGSFGFFVEDEYADHETKCLYIVTGVDENGCVTGDMAQYSLTKLKSPSACP